MLLFNHVNVQSELLCFVPMLLALLLFQIFVSSANLALCMKLTGVCTILRMRSSGCPTVPRAMQLTRSPTQPKMAPPTNPKAKGQTENMIIHNLETGLACYINYYRCLCLGQVTDPLPVALWP